MKYTEALAQKGLPLKELSKSIQKKVIEFTFLKEQIEALEQEDLDETTTEDLKNLSVRLEELDEEISVAIIKFDKEKHLKKLQQLQESKRKSLELKAEQVESEVSPILEHTENKAATNIEAHTTETAPLEQPYVEETENEEVESQFKQVEQHQKVPQYQEQEPDYYQSEEEFEVKRTQKSKKGSLNILIIGVGVFLVSWGTINFFRENRR